MTGESLGTSGIWVENSRSEYVSGDRDRDRGRTNKSGAGIMIILRCRSLVLSEVDPTLTCNSNSQQL